MTKLINAIAADILTAIKTNPHGFTVETLVANWESKIEWLSLKRGGKAWQRELLSMARSAWIASTQQTTVAIPPSEETLSWGGFLGGEIIVQPAMVVAAEDAFYAKFAVAQSALPYWPSRA